MTGSEQQLCIRCEEPTAGNCQAGGEDYHVLTLRQERGALAICDDCFQEVGPVPSGSEGIVGEALNYEILFIILSGGAMMILILLAILRYSP